MTTDFEKRATVKDENLIKAFREGFQEAQGSGEVFWIIVVEFEGQVILETKFSSASVVLQKAGDYLDTPGTVVHITVGTEDEGAPEQLALDFGD